MTNGHRLSLNSIGRADQHTTEAGTIEVAPRTALSENSIQSYPDSMKANIVRPKCDPNGLSGPPPYRRKKRGKTTLCSWRPRNRAGLLYLSIWPFHDAEPLTGPLCLEPSPGSVDRNTRGHGGSIPDHRRGTCHHRPIVMHLMGRIPVKSEGTESDIVEYTTIIGAAFTPTTQMQILWCINGA